MISLNHALIQATELFSQAKVSLRRRAEAVNPAPDYIEDIRIFCPPDRPSPSRQALMSLVPSSWLQALAERPNIRFFNQAGLMYEMVKALNEKGFAVDIVNCHKPGIEPRKRYDFFLGHGGHTRCILDRLPPNAFVMQYASTSYWKEFNRMSQERYDDFCRRRNLPPARKFVRSLDGTEEGEEYLARRADAAFLAGPRTLATFKGVSRNMSLLYLGSYVEKDLLIPERDFDAERTRFIYTAGTSGNVQKGLDLLLETFARLPHLHLYIYCKVEDEVRRAYRKELALPNIHYIYHYSRGPLRAALRRLLRQIHFTISAPINIGPTTALLGSMGLGLIPVGYADIEAAESNSVLTDSCTIETLMDCAERASQKSAAWCRQASQETLSRFQRLHDPPMFGANFKALLERLGF
jgi:glycosyltransferase involved in cell wall biosynthesis